MSDINERNEEKTVKAVVFDFDGTLYDKKGFVKRVIMHNLTHMKLLVSERRTRRAFHGKYYESTDEYYEAFFDELARNAYRSPKKARRWYMNKYLPSLSLILEKHYKIRDGFNEFFSYCNKHDILVVLYSDYEIDLHKMKVIGAKPRLFDFLLCAPDFGGLKPCAEAFNKALKVMNVEPRNVLFVGDSDECDGGVARNTGCDYMDVNDFIKSELFLRAQHRENEER